MQIIDLSTQHEYRYRAIASLEQVKGPQGKTYTKIEYCKKDPLLLGIAARALFVTCILGTLGLLLASSAFREGCEKAFTDRLLEDITNCRDTVYAETAFEKHLWRRIQECPSAHQLYQEAQAAQAKGYRSHYNHSRAISLHLFPKGTFHIDPEKKKPWPAYCNYVKGEIHVSLTATENSILSSMIFELGNLKQQESLKKIHEDARKGLIGVEEFAKNIERVEFETGKICNRILADLKLSHLKYTIPGTFEEDWQRIRNSIHTQFYRRQFAKLYGHRKSA